MERLVKSLQSSEEHKASLAEVLATVAFNSQRMDSLAPFSEEHEAMALAAFAVRNSDIVETRLHSKGERLSDQLMPEFNGEIAYRMLQILSAKRYLIENDFGDLWSLFVRGYHDHFCSNWKFHIPPQRSSPFGFNG